MAKTFTFQTRKHRELRVVIAPLTKTVTGTTVKMESLNDDFPRGLTVEFKRGLFTTSDAKVADALRNHNSNGVAYFEIDGQVEAPKVNDNTGGDNTLKCDVCEFVAASETGLKVHKRTHA